jgi:hypothetical protein
MFGRRLIVALVGRAEVRRPHDAAPALDVVAHRHDQRIRPLANRMLAGHDQLLREQPAPGGGRIERIVAARRSSWWVETMIAIRPLCRGAWPHGNDQLTRPGARPRVPID